MNSKRACASSSWAARYLLAAAGVLTLACVARAADLSGVYTYKLVLRDDSGFALRGTETYEGDESVSENYMIEVYNSEGVKVGATLADESLGSDRSAGYNCTLSVPVGEGAGYAKKGEQLTLVVTTKYDDSERFRSSKVLPPVGGTFGFAKAPVGVFFGDASDTDDGWNRWLKNVGYYLPSGTSLGGPDDDYDNDGLSNMREYQLGTDPAGGALGLEDGPGFKIEEQGDAYKVSFNYCWGHVYSIRVVEGVQTVGIDGQDLPLYESLGADTAYGTYFYENDGSYTTGTRVFFVKKPALGKVHLIGLAVDGRLQEYIQVGESEPSSVLVTPGFPLTYDTEAAANAAKAIAEVAPSEAVASVLTGEGAADGYKAAFTVEVRQDDGQWLLAAELTPPAQTNLMENATAATRQIPVAEIAQLPAGATTNVVLTGCTPGFYYSLHSGAEVTNIVPDAEAKNLSVLCDADGEVEFPLVKKPDEGAGFFKVAISEK